MLTAIVSFVVGLGLGTTFSQRIKDWLKGVPAAVRAQADKIIADHFAQKGPGA